MWGLLGIRGISTFNSRGSKSIQCGPCGAKRAVSIDLEPAPPPGNLSRMFASWLAAGFPPPAASVNQSNMTRLEHMSSEWQREAIALWAALNDTRTLTVFNLGAHYPAAFNSSGQSYVGLIEDMLAVRNVVRHHQAGSRLVYRTTPMGHPGCAEFRAPAQPALGAEDRVYESIARMWFGCKNCEGIAFDKYGWQQFAGFDRAARDMLLPLGASILDVTTPSVLRPDAHTAFRHGGGRLPPDCLHWSLPGVPDVWNLMLVGALMRCAHTKGTDAEPGPADEACPTSRRSPLLHTHSEVGGERGLRRGPLRA